MPGTSGAIKAGRAFVELFSDDSKLTRGLKLAGRKLKRFAAFTSGIGAGLFGGAVTLAAPFAKAISSASDLEETMNKFNVVFGDSADEVKAWSDSTADAMGRSKREIASFMAGAQDLLIPIGVDERTATEASKALTKLAVDLASFNNMRDADVMRDLQAALTGSSETMKKYGVVANEAAVKQELLNSGINPKKATEAQKALARLNIIIRGTTAAQGDAVRSGGSFANVWKRIQAKIEDASASVGAALLPTLAELGSKVADAIASFGDWASKNQGLIVTIAKVVAIVGAAGAALVVIGGAIAGFGAILGGIATAFSVLSSAIVGIVTIAGSIAGALLSPIGLIIGAVIAAGVAIVANWEAVKSTVVSIVGSLVDAHVAAFRMLVDVVVSMWRSISGAIVAIVTALGDQLDGVFAGVKESFSQAWKNAISWLSGALGSFGSWFSSMWSGLLSGLAQSFTAFGSWLAETIGSVVSSAIASFTSFKDRALDSWGAIRDAVSSGDLSLAFRIIVLTMKAEFARLISVLKAKWSEWSSFFSSVWTNAVFGAAKIMVNSWSGLQSFWFSLVDTLADAWSTFTGFISKNWNSTVGFLRKAWEGLKRMVTGDDSGPTNEDIDRETNRMNLEEDARRRGDRRRRNEEREEKLGAIEAARSGAIEALDEEVRRREAAREAGDEAEMKANEEALRKAREELAKAIGEARAKRKEKEDEGRDKLKIPGLDELADFDLSKLGLGAVEAKSSVEGTTTGFDRFGGFGKEDEGSDRKKMIDKLDKIEQHTKKTSKKELRPTPFL